MADGFDAGGLDLAYALRVSPSARLWLRGVFALEGRTEAETVEPAPRGHGQALQPELLHERCPSKESFTAVSWSRPWVLLFRHIIGLLCCSYIKILILVKPVGRNALHTMIQDAAGT